jgi:hypothetical protein
VGRGLFYQLVYTTPSILKDQCGSMGDLHVPVNPGIIGIQAIPHVCHLIYVIF